MRTFTVTALEIEIKADGNLEDIGIGLLKKKEE
jgi:hypothetical protein